MAKFDVDEALIRKLAELLEQTGLTEIEYENGPQRIRVNKQTLAAAAAVAAPAPVAAAAPAAAAPAKTATDGPPAGAVTSPMVGTVYLSPEPGASPFVKVGDRVSKGQTLLIIEAMKVMNPIPAPAGGTVREIAIADGRPVEYGEVLMVVD
ncbi:MAG TPA: acetyl-CoA carboxylase biotin carboxyl carrier protein [Hypericibacter adhaerens]|uniref:acetyl-CoA carboxylase biotin carboxyl carrier protein n=1 Tax=Hypericibacter adhaerens TaxID=2602016 RepID=UPI002B83F1B5|nr:acetyl-CoA carboxylase biotin carboxyl carrier protein [Hypericibacter adhaerens]HWA45663.1 acetyl-CoA carboxylase biotin carboxyl carrier protein [Hypericibacter adhaerens]